MYVTLSSLLPSVVEFEQVGESSCGKSNVIRLLAGLLDRPLHILSMSSDMDTTELLGGFEQVC